MKKMILTAVMLAAAALCRAQQPAETGERREWLTSFTAVEVSAPLDVKFVQVPDTEAPKIVYDTKGSYTTKFRAEVKDKVLRITERSDARRPDRTSVTVYYNSLERVAIADAVDIPMILYNVPSRTGVKDLKMELTGKSTATLTGAVRYLSLFVSTGKLEAAGLEVMAAEANVTSSGVAALWVTDRFQGKTSTGGKITYKGAPPIVRSGAKFMGGDITRVE